jgi:DNA-binding CsgD family transcriptional regulator
MPPLFQLTELECWTGRLDRAGELTEIAQRTCERAGLPAMQSMFLHARALRAARAGDLEAARVAASACRVEATQSGDVRNLMRGLAIEGLVELCSGLAADAVDLLEESWRLQQDCGYGNPAVIRSAGDHVEALLSAGRTGEAADLLVDIDARAKRTGSRWTAMVTDRCRGLLAAQHGDLAAARRHLEASLAQPRLGDPVEHGRSLLALAIVQRRSNQRATARATAKQALDTFAKAQAAAWADQARAELERLDGAAATMNGLTRMETEVAALISAGRTNNEIATELYVSPKTVESHLTHIYRKLGLRSRTELAGRVTAHRGTTDPRETPDAYQSLTDLP